MVRNYLFFLLVAVVLAGFFVSTSSTVSPVDLVLSSPSSLLSLSSVSGSAVAGEECGFFDERVCDSGCFDEDCSSGECVKLVSRFGYCVACGVAGEPACSGGNGFCGDGLVLEDGFCRDCGDENEFACVSGCGANLISVNGVCVSCGGLNEPACGNGERFACSDGLLSLDGVCVECSGKGFFVNDVNGVESCGSCGHAGEPSCVWDGRPLGVCVGEGLALKDGLCECVLPGFNVFDGECVSCGGLNETVCPDYSCREGEPHAGKCLDCGGAFQEPCPDSACDAGLAVEPRAFTLKSDNTVEGEWTGLCVACGLEHQPACSSGCVSSLVFDQNGVCVSCGGLNEKACDFGCTKGFTVSENTLAGGERVCVSCGGLNEPYCVGVDGGYCDYDFIINDKGLCTNECGGAGEPACNAREGSGCGTNQLVDVNGVCVLCGGVGQPVCEGNRCLVKGTSVADGKCVLCGGVNQPACSDGCREGLEFSVEFGVCVECGGLNERSCTYLSGGGCDTGLVETETGYCVACGGLGQPVCVDGRASCESPYLYDVDGVCLECGLAGRPACVSGCKFAWLEVKDGGLCGCKTVDCSQ